MKRIAVMGSTGSIGTQTLDIIAEYPERFEADVLVAGSNISLLEQQARRFNPRKVVIADETKLPDLRRALADTSVAVAGGREAVEDAGCDPQSDIVVGALVGYAGLAPTLNAIREGKTIALANKETLVVAGKLMTAEAAACGSDIIPVDSEHSAIFQCLAGEKKGEASRIFLTASGGPFRTLPKEKLRDVSVEQALAHPNWQMGAKVTIDSASMMNKGFEMIEAHWLFGCPPGQIEVVVHPQSIVHSMVEFRDGSVKAQLGLPDMHLPIRYALGYPERLPAAGKRLQVADFACLTFETPDHDKFPMLALAYEAIRRGGNAPCILNAANEVAVKAFLNRKIRFTEMADLAGKALQSIPFVENPGLDDLVETHNETTSATLSLI